MGGKKKAGPQVLAITNQKGGVAKTATAVNLAATFSKNHKKSVLLIDADFQANASSYLGLKITARVSGKTLADGLLSQQKRHQEVKVEDVIIPTKYKGLDLIAGSMELAKFNNDKYNPYKLKNWLKKSEMHRYDIIIIDTHPDLSHMFVNVMSVSDYYLIPLFAEPDSFDGIAIMFQEIKEIQANFNPTLHLLGACLTRFKDTNSTHKKFKKEIKKLGEDILMPLLAEIPVSDAIASSSDAKIPLPYFKVKQRLPVRDAYDVLATRLLKDLRARRGRTPKTPEITNDFIENVYNQFNSAEENDYVFE